MSRKNFAIIGVGLSVISAWTIFYVSLLSQTKIESFMRPYCSNCSRSGCSDVMNRIIVAKPIMSEAESQVLTVFLSSNDEYPCEADVTLMAPDFFTGPAETSFSVNIPVGKEVKIIWILSPRKTGHFEIMVRSFAAYMETYTKAEITVTNILGLSPLQAKLFSYLGMICGPMLTVPWWFEQRRKIREDKEKNIQKDKIQELEKQIKEIKSKKPKKKKVNKSKKAS